MPCRLSKLSGLIDCDIAFQHYIQLPVRTEAVASTEAMKGFLQSVAGSVVWIRYAGTDPKGEWLDTVVKGTSTTAKGGNGCCAAYLGGSGGMLRQKLLEI